MDVLDVYRSLLLVEEVATAAKQWDALRIAERARWDLEQGGSVKDAENLLKTAEWRLQRARKEQGASLWEE